ncbi:MAG TPA: caspase family protein [Treponemataceae bacterium]|nr:caspase family protein [Treponemataceae bacterium]
MNNRILNKVFFGMLCASATFSLFAEGSDSAALPVERYALYVASNAGGATRETLKYAYTDATRLARTMNEIGGIKSENSLLLSDPSPREINDAFADIATLVKKNAGRAKRTEFLFYYSGHSDENAFLLGANRYAYGDLKNAIDRIPSDVHVVMLDSCYSGNFVRAKGGSRQKPFLMDDSSIVAGHAYLSSSSGFESSQESDMIQASYFTHALVTGLRGAADTSGDNKVSLNELYHYAFNETLSSTELSSAGPQHPSYDITLVGSGDLVLTDLSVAESVLHIGAPYEGRFFIRDSSGQLVSELNKTHGTEVTLALPAGTYAITVVGATSTTQGSVTIAKGERLAFTEDSFVPVQRTYGRSRGESPELLAEEEAEDEQTSFKPFSLELVPGFSIPDKAMNSNIALGLFWGINDNISGVQLNTLGGTINESLRGAQVSGFINILNGDMKGYQLAGFLNVAKGDEPIIGVQQAGYLNVATSYLTGAQLAGLVNYERDGFKGAQVAGLVNVSGGTCTGLQMATLVNVARDISGLQVGLVNVARKNDGVSLGLLNFILEGVMSPAFYVDSNGAMFAQYQGGTRYFYTTFLVGTDITPDPDFVEVGFGIGTRIEATKRVSFDIEILSKNVYHSWNDGKVDDDSGDDEESVRVSFNEYGKNHIPSLRVSAQYAFYRHLSVFTAFETELMFDKYNNEAFSDYGRHSMHVEVAKDALTVYPTFSLGLKF